MITFKDHEDDEGNVDWNAYNKAQTAAGERCEKCGSGIIFPKGFMTTCSDCKALSQDHGEVSHDDFIRCPRCGHTHYTHDGESYDVFEDGTHSYSCIECNYDFEFTTHVSFTFNSPEKLKGWHKCDYCDEWYEEAEGTRDNECLKCVAKAKLEDEDGPANEQ